ncbi:hypothetical protein GWK47_053554 [Chionoecetes opilio]|uniref:Thyroglobulin type-1 domain-containing protein n=1 Tax=Chionoecetes opilio TaxID=41210 RepID=A0A8J4Y5C9_CHIOP|nr:hypothetical protein GWK47_053554 [Chionoecetes opilio]
MVSFDRGGFNLVQQDTSNGYVIQGFPLTDNWKNPTVVQVLQAGVDVGSTYDMEVADFKSEANAADSEINIMSGRSERWRAVLTVAVVCALCGLSDGGYEAQSILCDDIDAICSHYYGIVYDTNITECADDERKFSNPSICNCGLMCIENLEEGDFCLTSSLTSYPSKLCGPGLECKLLNPSDPSSSVCIRNPAKKCVNDSLMYEQGQELGTLGPGRNKPNCDEYGSYSPRQCSPSSTCYCVNPEGKRLFGEAPFTQETDINCNNPEIHTEAYANPCVSAQEEWDTQGSSGDVIVAEAPRPMCSTDGYYATVQHLNGKAYCADMYGNRIEDYELPIHEAKYMNCFANLHMLNQKWEEEEEEEEEDL